MPRESMQRKLERIRPPRVHITYDSEIGEAIEKRELPFVIGVLGSFSGSNEHRPRFPDCEFRRIDFDTFDGVMAEIGPRARFTIPGSLASEEFEIDLTFSSLQDFEPENLIDAVGPLKELKRSNSAAAPAALARLLDSILHAPQLQEVESAWRGLWYLVSRTESSPTLQIQLLDVSERELMRDLRRAPTAGQSRLFKVVYEEPYGRSDSDPFALLLGNFSFGKTSEDVALLASLAELSSCAHAPFIAAAAPDLLGLDDFRQLAQVRDFTRTFDSPEYAGWSNFRLSSDARYVALTLPRILLRSPYGIRPGIPGEFQYDEDTGDGRYLLWGNPAFAFGACVANAFARYGWCGAIRGIEGGGLVDGLPTFISEHNRSGPARFSVEVKIDERLEKELADLGFLPLVQYKTAESAAFLSTQACCKPAQYLDDEANVNSRLSCQLQYTLTASRFMHYFKIMSRDRIGSYITRGDLEQFFSNWISQYILIDDQASPAIRAQFPLREARVEVLEDPTRPGSYRIVAFLRPYFQLDDLSVSLRLVGSISG